MYTMSKNRFLSSPSFINIYLTNECNLNCTHCIDSAGRLGKTEKCKEMSDEDIYNIIDYYLQKGVYSLSFSGGEPLLRKSVFEFLAYVKEKNQNVETTLITNSTLINDKVLEKLEKSGLYFLRTSIESHIPEIHDSIRGKGNFKLVISKIKKILDSKIPIVGTSTTVSKINLDSIGDTVKYLYNLGVRHMTLAPLMPSGRGKDLKDLILSPLEFKQLHENKQKWMDAYKGLVITMDSPLESLLFKDDPKKLENCGPCIIGTCFLGFKANGDVYACPMRDEVIIGNFHNDDLDDLWKNSDFLNIVRNKNLLKGKCKNCPVKFKCGGGCRAFAHVIHNDITCPDPFCWRNVDDD